MKIRALCRRSEAIGERAPVEEVNYSFEYIIEDDEGTERKRAVNLVGGPGEFKAGDEVDITVAKAL